MIQSCLVHDLKKARIRLCNVFLPVDDDFVPADEGGDRFHHDDPVVAEGGNTPSPEPLADAPLDGQAVTFLLHAHPQRVQALCDGVEAVAFLEPQPGCIDDLRPPCSSGTKQGSRAITGARSGIADTSTSQP